MSFATCDGSPMPERPVVVGLQSGLVPMREFPLRKWYYASKLWYYHEPALEHRLRPNSKFYELVDPALRELCALVLQAGLSTIPSCEGHFYPRDHFAVIWAELERELPLIRGRGLPVRDAESDELYLFRNGEFALPWTDFETFYARVSAYQCQGYIGVVVPDRHADLFTRLSQSAFHSRAAHIAFDHELTQQLEQPVFSVQVTPESPRERDAAWAEVTAHFRALLA